RSGADRDDLLAARSRPFDDQCHPRSRLSGGAGGSAAHGLRFRRGEPYRRFELRLPRPADPLSMTAVEIAATEQAAPPRRNVLRVLRRPTARVGAAIVALFLLLT